jgi:hypothetical protein
MRHSKSPTLPSQQPSPGWLSVRDTLNSLDSFGSLLAVPAIASIGCFLCADFIILFLYFIDFQIPKAPSIKISLKISMLIVLMVPPGFNQEPCITLLGFIRLY